ncbi:MAG: hypothetical protein WBW69_09750 [Candidatus Korobacteraceae bacterium]
MNKAARTFIQFAAVGCLWLATPMLAQSTSGSDPTLQRLSAIDTKLDKLQEQRGWGSPAFWLPGLFVLMGAAGGWFAGYLTKRVELRETRATKQVELDEARASQVANEVVQSLKWFEGGSQPRSIGIAYIESRYRDSGWSQYRPMWGSLLVNQAIYLLTESGQGAALHEQDNLKRIVNLLYFLRAETYKPVRAARDWKKENPSGKGVSLTKDISDLVDKLPPL